MPLQVTHFFRVLPCGNSWRIIGYSQDTLHTEKPVPPDVDTEDDKLSRPLKQRSTLAQVQHAMSTDVRVPWLYVHHLCVPAIVYQAVSVFTCAEEAKQWRSVHLKERAILHVPSGWGDEKVERFLEEKYHDESPETKQALRAYCKLDFLQRQLNAQSVDGVSCDRRFEKSHQWISKLSREHKRKFKEEYMTP